MKRALIQKAAFGRRGFVVFAGFAAILFLIGLVAGWNKASTNTEQALLQVPPESLQFGEVWLQHDFRWRIPVSNPSDSSVQISRIFASCGCVSVEPQSLSVPAKGSADILLTMDLGPQRNGLPAPDRWPFIIAVTAEIDHPQANHCIWQISGSVRNPFDISPSHLVFSDPVVVGIRSPTQIVDIRPNIELSDVVVKGGGDWIDSSVESLPSTGMRRLIVSPRMDVPVGYYDTHIVIEPIRVGGERLPPVRLPVKFIAECDLEVIPAMLALGGLETNREAAEILVARSRTGRPLSAIAVAPADRTSLEVTISDRLSQVDSGGFSIPLVLHPKKTGVQLTALSLSAICGSETLAVPVTVSYSTSTGER